MRERGRQEKLEVEEEEEEEERFNVLVKKLVANPHLCDIATADDGSWRHLHAIHCVQSWQADHYQFPLSEQRVAKEREVTEENETCIVSKTLPV